MAAHIISVNIAKPRTVTYKGKDVQTGIRKKPISDGRVSIDKDGLCGDAQADRVNHGGEHKAVYAYASEHYRYWRDHHDLSAANYGLLGENLTTVGILDKDVCIGDDIAIGDTVLRVTQPRIPCYKLNITIGREGFNKLFANSARLGFYMKVIKTGSIGSGDEIEVVSRHAARISVEDIARLYFLDTENYREMARAIEHGELPFGITKVFRHRLSRSGQLFT